MLSFCMKLNKHKQICVNMYMILYVQLNLYTCKENIQKVVDE